MHSNPLTFLVSPGTIVMLSLVIWASHLGHLFMVMGIGSSDRLADSNPSLLKVFEFARWQMTKPRFMHRKSWNWHRPECGFVVESAHDDSRGIGEAPCPF